MTAEIRRGADRFTTETPWSLTRHSFSFGPHYDPDNVSFGSLLAHNDELLQPGPGYEPHPHRGIDIVSWVVDGALRHEDSTGATAVTPAGAVQVLRTGDGVQHAERSAGDRPVRFIQMWFASDAGGVPSYDQPAVSLRQSRGPTPLVELPGATVSAAHLAAGEPLTVPAAACTHLFVVEGRLRLDGGSSLDESDAARVRGAASATALTAALVLLCSMPRE